MGMFTSLFGSAGSDKADKLRQEALDSFDSIKTPALSALQVQLNKAVNAGTITPEQAEAQLLNSNAFNEIHSDPSLMAAQKQALSKLQEVGNAGGLTATDKARLQDVRDQQEQENHSSNEAIMAQARARGTGNSNLSTTNNLIQQQAAADRASKAGTDVAAQAEARALQALVAAGQLGGQMDSQQFGQQATKAAAQNDIDKFNAANKTDLSKFNVANNLSAQGANVANAQHVNDANTSIANAEKVNNANANQTVFQDNMAKANGTAGILNGWANDASATKKAETGADLALTGGLINAGAQAGGFALGGPAGGAAAKAVTAQDAAPDGYNPNVAPNQYSVLGYSKGGEVNTPDKSTSPSSIEDEYAKFMQSFACGGTVKMADGGTVAIKPGKKTGETMAKDLPITPAKDSQDWQLSDPNKKPIGDFPNYADAAAFAEKVKDKQPRLENFVDGGKVPGTAPVEGDSKKNDIVPAMLSPGEVVMPRTEVKKLESKPGDPIAEALKRLKNNVQIAAVRG